MTKGDRERWRRVEEVFDRVAEERPEDRPAALRAACGDDAEVRSEVASLLAAADAADAGLEQLARGIRDEAGQVVGEEPGRRVGSYRLLREIGRGGMGVVYLAERADGAYEQQVAIKLIRGPELGDAGRRRFLAERQILARLDHPAIARLLDGGTTDDGHPYLVMELVEGDRVDRWCRERGLGLEARLRLFQEICEAVESAHRQSVVHRDLKPSNILVTAEGRPKLLDFGIAKLLRRTPGDEAAEPPTVTLLAERALTPEFSSPEQVRGGPITAATDVYALGLLLYRLLTGVSAQSWETADVEDLTEVICHRAPPPPSTAVRRLPSAEDPRRVGEICASRDTTSGRLALQLAGDLDRIVLKAIRKEPSERYASAQELADDVGRWLDGRPVAARRGAWRYRVARALRRRPAVAAAVLTAVVVAGLFLALAERTGSRSRLPGLAPSRGPAAGAAAPAPAPLRRVAAVLPFRSLSGGDEAAWLGSALSELLTSELAVGEAIRVLPGGEVVRGVEAAELGAGGALPTGELQALASRIGADVLVHGSYLRLADAAGARLRVDCRVADRSGGSLVSLSESGSEGELLGVVARLGARLREALGVGAVSAAELGALSASRPDNPQAARRYASGLEALRRFDGGRARDLLREAIAADPDFALAHAALARVWAELGHDGRAREASRRAYELAADLSRSDRLAVEALFYEAHKDWDRAIEVHTTRQTLFPDDPAPALDLARVLTAAGRSEAALETLDELAARVPDEARDPRLALAAASALGAASEYERQRDAARRAARLGGEREAPSIVAHARLAEWWALRNLGQLDAAAGAAAAARAIFEETGERSGLARALNAEATLLADQGRLEEATALDLRALEIFRQIEDRRRIGWSLNNLGRNLRGLGDFAGARRMYEESLAISREIDDASAVARAEANLGRLLMDNGELAAAERLHEDSLRLRRQIGEERGVAGAVLDLGLVQLARGDLDGAVPRIREAVDSFVTLGDKQSAAHAVSFLGDALLARGEVAAARSAFARALALRREIGSAVAARSRLDLAGLELADGRPAAAAEELETLLSPPERSALGPEIPFAHGLLAVARGELGEATGAREAIAAARRALDERAPFADRLEVELLLARAEGRLGDDVSATLARLEREAATAGYGLLAARARELQAIGPAG